MRRDIRVCRRIQTEDGDTLRVLETKRLEVKLDDTQQADAFPTVYVHYRRQKHEVKGTIYFPYIEIE